VADLCAPALVRALNDMKIVQKDVVICRVRTSQYVCFKVVDGGPELVFRPDLEDRIIAKREIQNIRRGDKILVSLLALARISNEFLNEIWVDVGGGQLFEKCALPHPVRPSNSHEPPIIFMKSLVRFVESSPERRIFCRDTGFVIAIPPGVVLL
jgi:hypothetical protein